MRVGVCLCPRGNIAQVPLAILGRGLHWVDGHWGSFLPATRAPLGSALRVSRRARDRMGLCAVARQNPRHQLQWHVYRVSRPAVGRRRLFSSPGSRSASQNRLLCEARGAWSRYGCFCYGRKRAASAALSGSPSIAINCARVRVSSVVSRTATQPQISLYYAPSFTSCSTWFYTRNADHCRGQQQRQEYGDHQER
jgi:hypothetical protein